jgi:hypothetical protein
MIGYVRLILFICSITNPIYMKLQLLICILFIASSSYAQDYMENVKPDPSFVIPTATNFRTYGYIDGKRLDSVDAVYAEFNWRAQDRVTFDYGQQLSRVKQYVITDAKGVPMIFPTHSYAFLLNFFHYNGWEFVQAYGDSLGRVYILKKLLK